MNSRRAFLGVLGAGAVGSGAIGYEVFKEDESTNDAEDKEEPSQYEQALKTANESLIVESVQQPKISFDYDPIRTNVGDTEPLLERVEAVPLDDQPADTLRVFPTGELEQVTDYFTAILGTTIGEQTFTINGEQRAFALGEGAVPFFIWNGKIEAKSQILVGRGEARADAEAAVNSFKSNGK